MSTINDPQSSVTAVLHGYAQAALEFDANVLQSFLAKYPEHALPLLRYAQMQLISVPATPEEIEREEVSDDELRRVQSKVLRLLDRTSPSLAATHYCKDCGALWRQCDDYSFNLRAAHGCPACELEHSATQLIALRDERERLRTVAQAHGSALHRAGTAAGLSAGADLHRDLVPAIESLQVESLRLWVGDADDLLNAAQELLEVAQAIEGALRSAPAAEVLDENSPIRDALRDAIRKATQAPL